MNSLKELMDIELEKLPQVKYKSIDEFITSDKRSASFISSMTDGLTFDTPEETNPLYMVAQTRARHSAVSFLLGLVFKEFGNLFDSIGNIINDQSKETNFKLWLITALNHDRAYTSERLSNFNLNYRETFKYYLLDSVYEDNRLSAITGFEDRYPRTLAYTYTTIESYDKYARWYHSTEADRVYKPERVDHGILGGIILFNEMISKQIKTKGGNESELLAIKASGLAIAQHNIYKSDNTTIDECYKKFGNLEQLYSTSDFKITNNTPLLLLLSLIDTIECVKRFSKESNKTSSLQTLTVLNSIKAEVSKDKIMLDFSELKNEILKKENNQELYKTYVKHIDAICNLDKWTCIKIELDNYEFNDIIYLSLATIITEKENYCLSAQI